MVDGWVTFTLKLGGDKYVVDNIISEMVLYSNFNYLLQLKKISHQNYSFDD
jgi:hypothetical protein